MTEAREPQIGEHFPVDANLFLLECQLFVCGFAAEAGGICP
jgi:hypothetical protein